VKNEIRRDHIVLSVVDIEQMLHFYSGVLQLPGERIVEFAANRVPFPSVRLTADTILDLFPKKLWQKSSPDEVCRPNLNYFCLVTDKAAWDQLQVRLQDHGIPLEEDPERRWGAHGTGTSIYFRDPENNLIEVRYYEDAEVDPSLPAGIMRPSIAFF